ncbi:lysosome-associated membrane glycoprotein 5 isoform X1 [Parasteatoda tepidariorum]|uniref:lysosome-associated membrane glycoprotein 5 isoform X1 n=1 Tax=Parasteatoda tepidariorum TaxID=114398 RepID=UPI000A2BFF40|nr:lysosome-associated membrane glycoprotein 5 isoform X1 [Parasteatoda tepidariorum]
MAKFCCTTTTITVLVTLLKLCRTQSDSKDATTTPVPIGHFLTPTDDVLTKDVAPDFTFAVWDGNGKICILAKFAASFKITYPSIAGEQHISVNMPEDAKVKGRCGTFDREPILELAWPGFRLVMSFTVVNPKENQNTWELLSMELLYDTASPLFDGATNVGKKTVRTLEDGLFATPYGKSYFCPSPDVIPMYDSRKERVVLTRMKDVHLQMYDVQMGKFSQFQRCSLVRIGGLPEPFGLDETVPIAVGSTLAVMSVLVVLGYALWRNVATRKTDYDTVE